MGATLAEVLPLALGVAVSPVPVLAVLAVLLSDGHERNGAAYLAAWTGGLLVVIATVTALGIGSPSAGRHPSTALLVAEACAGVALLVAAVVVLRRRSRRPEPARAPRWLAALDAMTPRGAAGLAVLLLAVNIKDLPLTVAAGAKLSGAELSGAAQAGVIVLFTLVASATVAAPVLAAAIAGPRADPLLRRWHDLIARHGAVAVAIVLAGVGILLMLDAATRGQGHA